jgi:hypothetical protein
VRQRGRAKQRQHGEQNPEHTLNLTVIERDRRERCEQVADALTQAGPNPTRQDLVDTLEKGGLKGPGLVPYRFSAESHAGFTGVQIGKIDGGVFQPEGEPAVTDDGQGEITDHTEAQPEPPANGVPAVH